MKLSQFKFKLPEDRIALYPTFHRDESRLMVLHKKSGDIEHRQYFKDILDYFDDKDVFIFNDTKVFPARLYGNKEKTGATKNFVCGMFLLIRPEKFVLETNCISEKTIRWLQK